MLHLDHLHLERRVDTLLAPWRRPDGPGVTIGVVRDGELVLHRSAGLASIELGVPLGPATTFRVASVTKQVDAILTGRHMKDLIRTEVTQSAGRPRLSYRVDQPAWQRLQRTLLGKNILFTDQATWSDEAIVRAYRGQYHIEEAFKRMKNPHFVSWRPLHHWTDQKIRVHAFYCVLALLLSSLLRRTLVHAGIELSIVKILETLEGIKEVALIYRDPRSKTAPVISYSRLTPLQQRLWAALRLDRFKPSP